MVVPLLASHPFFQTSFPWGGRGGGFTFVTAVVIFSMTDSYLVNLFPLI